VPLKILPKPEPNRFFKPVESDTKPFGVIAETLNSEHVDYHRTRGYTRDKYYIHVSDLIQSNSRRRFCPREHALSFIEQRNGSYVRKISAGMSLLHTFGHGAQAHMTNDFIKRSPHGDKVWGNWRCLCGKTHFVMQLMPDPVAGTCKHCGLHARIYEEIDLLHEQYNITGHPDLFLLWGNVLHLYEIKTLDREGIDFDRLEAPLGDHTLQASFYYWMIRWMIEQGIIKHEIDPFVNYLYADRSNKKLFGKAVYREFSKRASPGDRIKPMLENARLLKESLDRNILPTRICDGPAVPRAKDCPVCTSCFNRRSNVIVAT
jgi:hypothetical protein